MLSSGKGASPLPHRASPLPMSGSLRPAPLQGMPTNPRGVGQPSTFASTTHAATPLSTSACATRYSPSALSSSMRSPISSPACALRSPISSPALPVRFPPLPSSSSPFPGCGSRRSGLLLPPTCAVPATVALPALALGWSSISYMAPFLGLACVASLISNAWLDARGRAELPKVHMVDTVFNSWVMDRCTTITEPYHPMPFLANGHVETIYAAFYRKAPTILYDRECLLMTDGGCIVLDSERDKDALPHDAPVLILLPGLTGGSHDSYVCYAVQTAREQGIRAVVFNSRGTSNSPVITPQYYSASYTGDMRAVVEYVSERYPKSTLLAGGWSLGANILIRYLAEEGESCKIAAAVSMCNPFNLVISNAAMETGFNKVYDSSLASNLVGMMEKHADIWKDAEGHVLVDKAKLAKNIRQFDDAITIRCFGWESVDEYYVGSSSSLSIPQVTMPLLCIQALDDPIAPKEAIPYEELKANPNCVLVTTVVGGHLGWVSGDGGAFGRPWSDKLMYEWLSGVLQEFKQREGGGGAVTSPEVKGEIDVVLVQ